MPETVSERLDVTVSETEPRVTVRLDGRAGSIYAGGQGSAGRLFLRRTVAVGGHPVDRVAMRFDASRGNVALGGGGTDGDLLLFPAGATISTTGTADAHIWLDADPGSIRLTGGLIPKEGPAADRQLPGYSTDEGAVAAFQGSRRFGVIDFTHEHPAAPGDREKLREIWIFNPVLHGNAIVLVTPHTAAPVAPTVGNMERRHDITGGEGRFIDLTLIRKLSPGTRVRIVYWILN